MNPTNDQSNTRLHNRIAAVMIHVSRYSFKGRARLAADAGLSKSTVTRLLNGKSKPSYRVVVAIASALERELKHQLDHRELISWTGQYPTTFVCQLVGCPGCLPSDAFDESNARDPRYSEARPGFWTGDLYEMDGPLWQPVEELA